MTTDSLSNLIVRRRLLVLLALGLLVYVPFLGMRDLWYPDEPDIGEVCKAMFDSGDWVAPRRMGEIWVDYPPMIYWAGTGASHLLGGFSEFALRLPNALAAIALVLLTCAAGSRWRDPHTGFWAGFLLLTFQQFAYEAVNYRPDVLFSLFIGAGIFVYAEGAGERPRWWLRLSGFALLGLAMLAKGPLGLLLPGLVLILWHGFRREWRRILELAPLSLVALAVYLPWFIACAHAMGADNFLYELYAQSFARFAGATHRGHGQPFYYYLTQIWVDLLWWGPLLPFGIWWLLRSGLHRNRDFQLALWWLGTFIVFLSLAVTKRQVYMLPAYPAAALLLAPWISSLTRPDLDHATRPAGKPVRIYGIALTVVWTILAIVMFTITFGADLIVEKGGLEGLEVEVVNSERAPAAAMGVLMVAAVIWLGLAVRRGIARQVLIRLGVVSIPFVIVVFAGIMPALNPSKTYRPQCQWIRNQIGTETSFGLAYPPRGHHKMGGFALYSGVQVELLNDREELDAYLRTHPGSVVLIHDEHTDHYFADSDGAWRDSVIHQLLVGSDRYLVVR